MCVFVSAAAAETRKTRSIAPGKKITNTATPVKLTPARTAQAKRTAVPRARTGPLKITTAPKAKRRALTTPRVGHTPPAVDRTTTGTIPRSDPSSETVAKTREAYASTTMIAPLELTLAQRYAIYRTIAEIPLQPRIVPTERVLPPTVTPKPDKSAKKTAPKTAAAESEPVVGAPLPPAVALHQMPSRAVEAVPEVEPYHYAFVGDRVFLVDPTTGIVVAAIKW